MSKQFRAGEFVTTKGAQCALDDTDQSPGVFLARHLLFDWGYIDEDQRAANEKAIAERQGEIRGVYKTLLGVELWMVTDKEWRTTTLMLPGEA